MTDPGEKVYFNHDLTPKEREADRALREELKARREQGEEDIVIRNGKIVKRLAKQATSSAATAGEN